MKLNVSRLIGFSLAIAVSLAPVAAQAETVQQLQAQQAAAQAAAQAALQAAAHQQSVAQQAAAQVAKVGGQIDAINSSIQDVQGKIGDTQDKIGQQDQQVADLESQLSKIRRQQDALVREMYIARESYPDDLGLFSSDVSAQARNHANFDSLKKSVQALYVQTQQEESQVQVARDGLKKQQDSLVALQNQKTAQAQTLADFQQTQSDVQSNAEATAAKLSAQAAQDKAQAAQLGQKITSLLAQNWGGSPTGNRLVPVEQADWYYSQQDGRWAGDTMGASQYTVGDFGCLITSLAMLAKRAGRSDITPQYIADHGAFTRDGFYIGGPSGIDETTSGVSWNYINGQLAAGNPVIVRLNLSSFYTHFVVIYAKSGSNYLIQDPWNPSGSGYSTSLVSGYGVTSGI